MPPRRRPVQEQEAPEGFVRAEDVQRLVQDALAAGQNQTRAPDEVPVADMEYERYSRVLARFQKMRPPQFGGESDPDATDGWVMELEKIFKALRCPREFWVELAGFTFTRVAEHWWRSVQDQFGELKDWEQFLALFRRRFLPEPVLRQKEEEFNKLQQGARSVWDYHADFTTLARYAPHLQKDEPRLARKFRSGLRFEIVRRMGGVPVDTVAQMVEIAQNVEIDINLESAARVAVDARSKSLLPAEISLGKKRKASSGVSAGAQVTLSGEGPPQRVRMDVECFNCHQRGHFRDKCPLPRQPRRESSVQTVQSVPQRQLQGQIRPVQSARLPLAQSVTRDQQRVQGRSFALASEDAAAGVASTSGILLIVFDALWLLFMHPCCLCALLLFCELVFSIPMRVGMCSHLCPRGWEGVRGD